MVGDFYCKHCQTFTEEVFPDLEDLAEQGAVNVYYLNPTRAEPNVQAAQAAECVFQSRPEAFWRYKKALYARRGELGKATLETLAAEHHVLLDGCDQRDEVRRDYDTAKSIGVIGTPSIIIKNTLYLNPSLKTLERAIDERANF